MNVSVLQSEILFFSVNKIFIGYNEVWVQ
jgi:hypothetical protein